MVNSFREAYCIVDWEKLWCQTEVLDNVPHIATDAANIFQIRQYSDDIETRDPRQDPRFFVGCGVFCEREPQEIVV